MVKVTKNEWILVQNRSKRTSEMEYTVNFMLKWGITRPTCCIKKFSKDKCEKASAKRQVSLFVAGTLCINSLAAHNSSMGDQIIKYKVPSNLLLRRVKSF